MSGMNCQMERLMHMYRFITPHRRGKWYPDLQTAQAQAGVIGAGFLDTRTGKFIAYRETELEVEDRAWSPGDQRR